MKIIVSTVGEVQAKHPISTSDMARFMKAVVGKSVQVDLPPTATLNELIAEVRRLAITDSFLTITSAVVLKGKSPAKGVTLSDCGFTDASTATVKFIHAC